MEWQLSCRLFQVDRYPYKLSTNIASYDWLYPFGSAPSPMKKLIKGGWLINFFDALFRPSISLKVGLIFSDVLSFLPWYHKENIIPKAGKTDATRFRKEIYDQSVQVFATILFIMIHSSSKEKHDSWTSHGFAPFNISLLQLLKFWLIIWTISGSFCKASNSAGKDFPVLRETGCSIRRFEATHRHN